MLQKTHSSNEWSGLVNSYRSLRDSSWVRGLFVAADAVMRGGQEHLASLPGLKLSEVSGAQKPLKRFPNRVCQQKETDI
jgi:hypothetical protein